MDAVVLVLKLVDGQVLFNSLFVLAGLLISKGGVVEDDDEFLEVF